MRYIGRVIWYLVALMVIVFLVANRAPITLSLWPLPFEPPPVPLYAVLLAAVAIGVVLGGTGMWINDSKWRRRARQGEQRARTLEREKEAAPAATAAAAPDGRGQAATATTASLPAPQRAAVGHG